MNPSEYAAQAILAATNDLLDAAIEAETLDDAIALARVVRMLRERIDAISNRALQRMEEITR